LGSNPFAAIEKQPRFDCGLIHLFDQMTKKLAKSWGYLFVFKDFKDSSQCLGPRLHVSCIIIIDDKGLEIRRKLTRFDTSWRCIGLMQRCHLLELLFLIVRGTDANAHHSQQQSEPNPVPSVKTKKKKRLVQERRWHSADQLAHTNQICFSRESSRADVRCDAKRWPEEEHWLERKVCAGGV
jgi:hypothetical protein